MASAIYNLFFPRNRETAAATTTNPDQLVIPEELLTLNNYQSWKGAMIQNLEWHSLWGYLDSREENRSIEVDKDKEALDAIKNSCNEMMLPLIMYAESAKEAWDLLEETASWTDAERANHMEELEMAALARVDIECVPEVDKILTPRNYGKWKKYMKDLLVTKHLWMSVLEGGFLTRSHRTKNHHALVTIRMSCGEGIFRYIEDEDSAHSAWYKLEKELVLDIPHSYSNDHELLTIMVDEELLTSSSNYGTWEVCMKNYLKGEDLWGFLEESEIPFYVRDERALDAIKVSCAPEMLAYILYMDRAKHAWEKLAAVAATSSEYEVSIRHCEMVKEAARDRENLSKWSEADKVLSRSNYLMWEGYMTMLLRSRFLSDVVLQTRSISDPRILTDYEIEESIIKDACALRIIKEACGRELMPYIFRSRSPRDAFNILKHTCLMDQKDEYMKYSRLLHAVKKNGFREKIQDHDGKLWKGAHNFFREFPEALTAEIEEDGSTALHVAVRLGRVNFVRELLKKLMTPGQSEVKTRQGATVMTVAVGGNNKDIVEELVKSNSNLLQIVNRNGLHAVTIAAINGNEMIMRYLYHLTIARTMEWGSKSVASLLTSASRLDAFDIVWDLLNRFPTYALSEDNDGMTVLRVLAEKPSAFPSGNQFGFLRGWLYWLVGSKTHGTLLEALKIIVPAGLKQVLDSKKKHYHTAAIVRKICTLLPNLSPHQLTEAFIYDAIHQSTVHGTIEVFKNLIDTNPYLENFKDENGRGLFQIAIINRQKSIFQYMSQMGQKNQDMAHLDNNDNNALHCAALRDPSSKPVHGPAIQIQRELRWFQEVERVVPPRYKEMRNRDKLTPKALFSREHKDLAKEAEKWMKDMAQACILVTALIATVMFAAPFTLPGGIDQNTGVSLTLRSRAFKVFIISDVISLFVSCTSLLMFFSILTARYAEHDFLTSLPRRLILGLFTLFIAIATMMTTFTSTVVIVLREDARYQAYIWVSILSCVPVVVFGLLQTWLFVNLISSTYGRGIIGSKRMVVTPLISIGYGNQQG